ncbi:DUF1365 domain-containing protein [Gordonia insulae]|uniref:DUF1365 domain-containing protein n=1 Tax=Gordonia insulae TaxID=2420509 RepID=UPI001E51CC63|nr:DUF1365 domain-containing protein [Gordonia insulae]
MTHTRRSPVHHAFTYRSASWLIDIDRPPELPAPLRAFARFTPADHFPQPAGPDDTLRSRLETHAASAGVALPAGQVIALLSPRVAGYVFNPLSVFWCHHPDSSLGCVVAEVHNTYGERHTYVVDPDEHGNARVDKEFYVSPFHDVSGTYRLHVPPPDPDGRVAVSVTLDRVGQGAFVAALTGAAVPATTRTVLATQITTPLAPLVVAARIRLHGIRLWLKRLPVVTRPAHTSTITVADATPSEEGER